MNTEIKHIAALVATAIWADGEYDAAEKIVVAEIAEAFELNADGFAAAVEAAQNGETIILIADVELTAQVVIPEGKVLTLDLNGKTVNSVFNGNSTTNHIYALSNKGTLTITDSTTEGNGSINSRGIYNYGSLTLNAGAINAIDGNGGYAVNNQSGSTFVMNGGVVAATNEDDHQSSSGGYDATALKVPAGCTATLNGGTINNVCDFTYAIDAAGTLNIPAKSTITVNGTHGAIYVSGGVTTIDAGTFQIPADNYSRTDNVLYVTGGSLVINGGTFIGDSDTASGGSCLYDAAGKAVVNGGTFKGSSGGDVWGTTGTTIKGGTFENLTETQHIAEGYEMNENGEVVEAVKEVKVATLAELQAALADNSSELPIIITETIVIPEGETVVLDLNGKTVTRQDEANQYALRNLGDLTIKDTKGNGSINARGIYNGYGDGGANVATAKITVVSGTINAKGTNGGGAAIFNYGVADIQGGTFTSVASYAIALQTGSTMTIGENAIITGGINSWQSTLTITGGTISNDKSGKHVVYAGESAVTINGGTFHNNNSGNATIMASGSTAAVEITGGTFTLNIVDASSSYLIDATSSATYTISGGSFTGGIRAQGGTKYEIAGGTFTNEYGNYNVYEGGDINISGGTFTGSYAQKFATDNLADGYELGANGTVAAKPVAEVNGVKYATFAEAVAAAHKATDKVTITLKKDITVSAAISINKLVTIDLNGKAISSEEGYVFEVTGGELVLQGEGSIGAICYIINDADYKAADKTFALTENKNNVDIVYNRTFGHTSWQVLYVPFAIPVENMGGFEVYSISDVTDSGVVIEQVVEGDLSANTPYIIKATEAGDKTIKVTGATLSLPVAYEKTIGNFTINGTYSSMAIDAESQYVLTNGLWCQLTEQAVTDGNNILGAFRVYLTANGENTPSKVRFVINNSDATAIDELKAENGNVKAEVYDLSGRRVEKAVKGIYVVNGVKVIK